MIAGFRDIAAHKYQTLHMDDVFLTAKTDLPDLKKLLQEFLSCNLFFVQQYLDLFFVQQYLDLFHWKTFRQYLSYHAPVLSHLPITPPLAV